MEKILAVGVSLLAVAGMLVGCTAQPVGHMEQKWKAGLSVAQDAAWTDLQKFRAGDFCKGRWAGVTYGKMKTRNMKVAMKIYSAVEIRTSLENDQHDFSRNNTDPTSYELVVWLSEYFQPDASFMAPEGCLKEELIETADGRSSSITGFRWKINPGEQGKQLKIPVTLRDEYRFPAEKHTVPTCRIFCMQMVL